MSLNILSNNLNIRTEISNIHLNYYPLHLNKDAMTETTKDALLRAAKKVFAAKGYDGATVKEVADEAGANISLVSYHFNGKENLFRACVQAYGEERLLATERFLKSPESAED